MVIHRRLARTLSSAAVVTLALLALPAGAAAQSLPKLTQPVHDFAGVLDATSVSELDRRIRILEKATPTHDIVVVVTVKTFEPYGSIEEYAVRLFEQAGIGDKKLDNGVLILLAHDDRQVRIEVGYDIEQFVTDGFAGDVIRQQMLPAFRKGDFGGGLLAGTTRIINKIAASRGVTLTDVPVTAAERGSDAPDFMALLPIAIIVAFVVIGMIRSQSGPRSRMGGRRNPWGGFGGPFGGGMGGFGGGFGGGGGGGGFGGFGGGMSGGGGASGRW